MAFMKQGKKFCRARALGATYMSNGLEGSKYLGQALRIWDVELLNFSLYFREWLQFLSGPVVVSYLGFFYYILWNLTTQSVVTG